MVFALPKDADPEKDHGWASGLPESWRTVANQVTVVRTVAAVALGVVALTTADIWLVVCGYAAYWVGDVLDGFLARRLDQETRRGAVLDIVADRICTLTVGLALVVCLPWTEVPVAVFLVQFAAVDLLLSLLFVKWPILSPNYFHLIDRVLYRVSWSPPAKALNTAAVVLVTALSGSAVAGTVVAGAVLAVKLVSLARASRLLVRQRRVAALVMSGADVVRARAG